MILGHINELRERPFIVGIYCGQNKPSSSNEFLNDFVEEWNSISEGGIKIRGKNYTMKLKSIIADLPGRAFIFNSKPSGYYSCPKCHVEGKAVDKKRNKKSTTVYYPETVQEPALRTDLEYKHMIVHDQTDVHQRFFKGETILKDMLGFIGGDTSSPLDFMHCGAGAIKKTCSNLIVDRVNKILTKREAYDDLIQRYKVIISHAPREVAYRLRNISEMGHWKSSEFFIFGIYTGIVALRELSAKPEYHEYFENFVVLSAIIRIISNQKFDCYWNDNLNRLVKEFLIKYQKLYGSGNCTLIMHTLKHIIDECKKHGQGYNFSAFKFESFFSAVKRLMVHSKKSPIVTILKRYEELR